LARQQQDFADLNNDLNTAEKKMKSIKSGWGALANIGSSKVIIYLIFSHLISYLRYQFSYSIP
jgi:hypothetical protein